MIMNPDSLKSVVMASSPFVLPQFTPKAARLSPLCTLLIAAVEIIIGGTWSGNVIVCKCGLLNFPISRIKNLRIIIIIM
jgi:hypothetical protein